MKEVTPLGSRKSDHIRINLEENTQSGLTTGLEHLRFVHRGVPEIDLQDVDASSFLFGKFIKTPLLISSMTGGTEEAKLINNNLAEAAQVTKVAMGVGSQRIAIEEPDLAETFQVRKIAPDILLFANLGAVQLNYGFSLEHCQRAVDMISADALVLHFNCLQEAVQNEGNTQFSGLIKKIENICKHLNVPVIAKEVGWGFSKIDIQLLTDSGVSAIDTAGAGGTSWSQVEMYRAENEYQRNLAGAFINWGIPTSEVIQMIKDVSPLTTIIASGGLRTGVDIAKCIALGASMGGMAGPFLKAAVRSAEATIQMINLINKQIEVCMFTTGSKNLLELRLNKIEKLQ